MAKIYGCAESEKELLKICPSTIKKYEEIDRSYSELTNQLKKEEKEFENKLPNKIKEQEKILENIKNEEKATIEKWDKEIEWIKNKNETNKKNRKWFSFSLNLFQSWDKNTPELCSDCF